ncbi:MAG: hypothetical protein ACOYWZ_09075 [Bacillota bacterium]
MNGYKNLYDLANGIYAAGRIREVLNSTRSGETRGLDDTNIIQAFSRILDILSEYAPEKQRNILVGTANKSRIYMDVFKNLNQNLNTYRGNRRLDRNNIVNTLTILQPVLGPRERILIDKIVKLNEVFS